MIWAVFALLSAVFAALTFILATVVHERTTAQQAISKSVGDRRMFFDIPLNLQ